MKSALFVVGGWEGHEPMLSGRIFSRCLEGEGYHTEIVENLDVCCESERLRRFDLIVPVWTMGTITNEQEKGLAGCDSQRHRNCGVAWLHGRFVPQQHRVSVHGRRPMGGAPGQHY